MAERQQKMSSVVADTCRWIQQRVCPKNKAGRLYVTGRQNTPRSSVLMNIAPPLLQVVGPFAGTWFNRASKKPVTADSTAICHFLLTVSR